MKIIIVWIGALALVLASCASSQGGSGENAAAGGSGGKQAGRASSGPVPIETKTLVLFADGSLDEYITSEYDPSFSNITNQARYSASGALLEQIEYSYQEEKGRLATKITRDVENRLKSRVMYEYNNKGLLWKETLINKAGKPISSYEYLYDSKGNRTNRIVNSGTGFKMAETVFVYNNSGALVSSETRDGSGKKISATENRYDNKGNLISQKVLNADGQTTTTINAVWQDGYEVKNEQAGPDGSLMLRVLNEYGSDGELLKKTVENIEGESTRILQYEYAFKPSGGRN